MRVLLRCLYVEDREKALHWLRRKDVSGHFLRKLGIQEAIDQSYKVMDVVKILISLFTPDVSARLNNSGQPCRDRIFFFAFDQAEAREALFENDKEWSTFFGQLSELYNALPNVFVLFTMTIKLRNKYIAAMEGQFRDRISHDQKFTLGTIEQSEVLALYRQSLDNWLGEEREDTAAKLEALANPYMPFDQASVLHLAESSTLRYMIKRFDVEFREAMKKIVIDVPVDFHVFQKEQRQNESSCTAFQYSSNHLDTVTELLGIAGLPIAHSAGMALHSYERKETVGHALPVLRIQFCMQGDPSCWVRVFIVRLPHNHTDKIPECLNLLAGLQKARNFVWLVRAKPIDASNQEKKPDQVYARELPPASETDLLAVLLTLRQKDNYPAAAWSAGEPYLMEKLKATYLGELLKHAREALAKLPSTSSASAIPVAALAESVS